MRSITVATLIAVAVLVLNASIASAHDHRTIGEYSIEVGFNVEPALVDEPNGLYLSVTKGEDHEGTPVEGLVDTLQAEIIYANESKPLDLRPMFDEPGAYTADVIPVATGAYSFRIWGSIEGTELDETFISGPETFSEVESKDEIAFPLNATDSEGATGDDDNARTLAIAGVVLGSLGLLAGIAGVVMAMNARNTRSPHRGVIGEVGD